MKVPSITKAEELLKEAKKLNPGAWVAHNITAGNCAKTIASKCKFLDADIAYVLGLLHDIGRRFGVMDMKHIWCGYKFMLENKYDGIF